MTAIRIEHKDGRGEIAVDGVKLSGVTQVGVDMCAASLPTVTVRMIGTDSTFGFDDANLKVEGLDVPASVEMALLNYLARKYPLVTQGARLAAGA